MTPPVLATMFVSPAVAITAQEHTELKLTELSVQVSELRDKQASMTSRVAVIS